MAGLPGGLGSGLLGNAIRRGLWGGSRAWRVVLAVVVLARLARAVSRPRPIALTERLDVGEALEVRHLRPGGGTGSKDSTGLGAGRKVVEAG
jgi:hypothetical protein